MPGQSKFPVPGHELRASIQGAPRSVCLICFICMSWMRGLIGACLMSDMHCLPPTPSAYWSAFTASGLVTWVSTPQTFCGACRYCHNLNSRLYCYIETSLQVFEVIIGANTIAETGFTQAMAAMEESIVLNLLQLGAPKATCACTKASTASMLVQVSWC